MLGDYLSQNATFSPAMRKEDGSPQMDKYGQILYGAGVSIHCRRQPQKKEIMTPDRQIIQITDTYYVTTDVRIDDLLDGRRIQNVVAWVEIDGEIMGYKAAV